MNCCFPISFSWPTKVPKRPHLPPEHQVPLLSLKRQGYEEIFSKKDEHLFDEYQKIKQAEDETVVKIPANFCADSTMILSEAPSTWSIQDFFNLVYTHSDCIIMLMQESDYERYKSLYPYIKIQNEKIGKFHIAKKAALSPYKNCVKSIFEITHQETTKTVTHIHYNHWVDCKVPSIEDLAQLTYLVLKAALPTIHCVAGIGRSGTLAAIASAYSRITAGNRDPNVIRETVAHLRRERKGAILTKHQYVAVYRTVKYLLTR